MFHLRKLLATLGLLALAVVGYAALAAPAAAADYKAGVHLDCNFTPKTDKDKYFYEQNCTSTPAVADCSTLKFPGLTYIAGNLFSHFKSEAEWEAAVAQWNASGCHYTPPNGPSGTTGSASPPPPCDQPPQPPPPPPCVHPPCPHPPCVKPPCVQPPCEHPPCPHPLPCVHPPCVDQALP